MDTIVKADILSVLAGFIDILKVKEERDISDVRELSNHTIHNASIFQDEDSVSIAILIYSFSKIMERQQKELSYKPFISLAQKAYFYLSKDNVNAYRFSIKKLFSFVSAFDKQLELYIEEVISQAQIKKGSKIYEHGISLARVAEIIGISQWELMNYVGKTTITDSNPLTDIKNRLKFARSLFK